MPMTIEQVSAAHLLESVADLHTVIVSLPLMASIE